eukprot:gnl/TRDRNA2_/TRDRNA2_175016_c0_seq1.p2 gnl/TRDRNA2_/TRDRNA2_175016_c0~~gnl/TRDRNA2_/TRDRNA2_175016_c0_seq1.p2  ORF type:complete len:105 (-),score=8.19 gnl/TRDRNA2_/TRDRNA2_175016_c0_seq1:234-548(-)
MHNGIACNREQRLTGLNSFFPLHVDEQVLFSQLLDDYYENYKEHATKCFHNDEQESVVFGHPLKCLSAISVAVTVRSGRQDEHRHRETIVQSQETRIQSASMNK